MIRLDEQGMHHVGGSPSMFASVLACRELLRILLIEICGSCMYHDAKKQAICWSLALVCSVGR